MDKEVLVTWRDEPEREFFTTVKIDDDWITDYSEGDDAIFFYFSNEDDYRNVLENGTEEFTMREVQ